MNFPEHTGLYRRGFGREFIYKEILCSVVANDGSTDSMWMVRYHREESATAVRVRSGFSDISRREAFNRLRTVIAEMTNPKVRQVNDMLRREARKKTRSG